MAKVSGKYVQRAFMIEGDEEEKWAKHYSSNHQILLVGEGDFSFALSLAMSFRSASNIVASSLDRYDDLIKKYERAKTNLELLGIFGAQLLHGVDATKMKLHTDLRMRKFDRIIYNFPHAGFMGKEDDHRVIMMHQNLVHGFFKNTSHMLLPDGEVHVSHKTTSPFNRWNIEELAVENCLALLECVEFKRKDYPGYNNKRGDGSRCNEPFPLGQCSTFKFVLSSIAKKPQQIPVWNDWKCNLIFREYFDHVQSTFGQADDNLMYCVHDALRIGFERYKAENCGKVLSGYINLLEELQYWNKQRLACLRRLMRQELVHQRGLEVEVEQWKVWF